MRQDKMTWKRMRREVFDILCQGKTKFVLHMVIQKISERIFHFPIVFNLSQIIIISWLQRVIIWVLIKFLIIPLIKWLISGILSVGKYLKMPMTISQRPIFKLLVLSNQQSKSQRYSPSYITESQHLWYFSLKSLK